MHLGGELGLAHRKALATELFLLPEPRLPTLCSLVPTSCRSKTGTNEEVVDGALATPPTHQRAV
jgi:hypothetical protein